MSKQKAIVSLFDYTGETVRPWAEAGYACWCFDIQHPSGAAAEWFDNGGVIFKVNQPVGSGSYWSTIQAIMETYDVVFMASFPPCTDLAVSGARHFEAKLAANPNYREEAMNLVYIAGITGAYLDCPYYIENPVSVISSEWRKPDFIFHPFEFGGYIPAGQEEHPRWPEYIAAGDAYTKKTCLWAGGGFELPQRKCTALPADYKYSKQHTQLGGKSLKTKNIRSATARGFALACFESYGKPALEVAA